jgi:membrane dipeptidase
MIRRSFLTDTGIGVLAALTTGASGGSPQYVVDGSDVSALSDEYLDMLAKGGIDVLQWNSAQTLLDMSLALEFVDKHSKRVALVRSFTDIAAAKNSGRLAIILGWQNATSLTEEAGNLWRDNYPPQLTLRAYYELGLRIMNLAYNLANDFAGGCLDPTVALSREGAYLIGQMQEIGILVDCGGHCGERSSLDVIKIAKRPVICTHSNVKSLNDNPRCTSDRVIEGIASTGGVFGVNAVDAFMTWGYKDARKDPVRDVPPQATVARYVDEIDYIVKLVGPDHVGLGPDFVHGLKFGVDPKDSFEFPIEMTYTQNPVRYAKGFEDITQIGNVAAELRKRNYSEENVAKIMGGNWMRVYRSAWN